MIPDIEELQLTDLIDINFLQEFQDTFSEFMGVASLTYGKTEPITKPSNFVNLCSVYIRKSELGQQRCQECDLKWGNFAAEKSEPQIYDCHAGLTDFVVPIMVGGKHIASIFGGQIFTHPPDEEKARETARELGIDEDEYIRELRKVKIIPREKVEIAVHFLSVVANAVSEIAHRNLLLMEKGKKENFYRTIVETIRSSLDTTETKNKIVELIGEKMGADRCFIIEYDKVADKFAPIENEYLASKIIPTCKGVNVDEDIPNFVENLKNGKPIIIKDSEISMDVDTTEFENERAAIEKYKVKSAFAIPLYYSNEFIGALALNYVNHAYEISEDDINLLNTVADQIATAIYQSRLYKTTQINAEREALLRAIIENIRSSLDIEEALSFICEETAKVFNVQRTAITEFPNSGDFKIFRVKKEYKSSSKIKGLDAVGNYDMMASYLGHALIDAGKVIAFDDIQKSETPDFFKNTYSKMGVKSLMGTPIKKGEDIWGTLVLAEYNNYRHWSEEDKNLLQTIGNQVYIAINQAELYNKEKETAKKEALLRKTIGIFRSTLDPEQIKKYFVDVIGGYFGADRCLFLEYDKQIDKFLNFRIEKLKSPHIKSVAGHFSEEEFPEFVSRLKNGKDIIISDLEKILTRRKFAGYKAIETLLKNGVKSDYGLSIRYRDEIMGVFIMHFVDKKRILTHDEFDFLNALRDQAGVALYQAELYSKKQHQVEREVLLRNIIQTVRSTLDIAETKKKIVEIIGKTLDSDRCFIAEYSSAEEEFLIVTDEYRSSEDILPYKGADSNKEVPNFARALKSGHALLINDKEIFLESDGAEYEPERKAIEKYSVNSVFSVPLFHDKDFLGVLAVHYVRKHYITQDEMDLLSTIADQIAIAIYQSKLYNTVKITTANQNALINNMPFMTWLKDEHSNLLAVNKEFARMCKTTIENIIGKTDFDFFPKEQAESYVKEDQVIMETRENIESVDLIAGPDGNRWHETSKSPVLDDKGNVVGTVGISRDITERKDAELELLNRQKKIIKAAEREKLLRNIVTTIRSSLDISETKQKIVNIIGETLNADRCLIIDYDQSKDEFLPVKDEYLSSDKISEYKGVNINTEIPKLAEAIKKGRPIIINNKEIVSGAKNGDYEVEKETIEKYQITSAHAIPLFYSGELLGVLSIHYVGEAHTISKEDMTLIGMIADQIATALHQSKLYKITQVQAEREKLLRSITETIRSTLDMDELFELICKALANIFNAQRSFVVEYKNMKFTIKKEFKSSPEIKGLGDSEFDTRTIHHWSEVVFRDGEIIIDNIPQSDYPDYFKQTYENIGEKSTIGIAIKKGDDNWGWVGIAEYDYYRHWSDNDINLLKTISSQIYIAIKQAELYQSTKNNAEREFILRKMIEIIRSSIDIDVVKSEMVHQIGTFLNADRVAFADYDFAKENYYTLAGNEYRSSSEVKTFVGYDFASTPGFLEAIRDLHISGKDIIFNNLDKYLEENNLKDGPIGQFYKNMGFASSMAINISHGDSFYGNLVVTFEQERYISEEDIRIVKTIADQSGIAIYQSQLYKQEKQAAERELLLRKIITSVRSSLDFNETLKLVCEEIAKVFDVQRVAIVEASNSDDPTDINVRMEYKTSSEIVGLPNAEKLKQVSLFWNSKSYAPCDVVAINSIPESDTPDFLKDFYKNLGVKSVIGVPISKGDIKWGGLHLSEYRYYRNWTEDEITLLKSISDQIYIAINQATLYNAVQKTAENERVLRQIMLSSVSTFDFKKVIKSTVTDTGELFHADRCFFVEFDSKMGELVPITDYSEYISSNDIKSILTRQPTLDETNVFLDALKNKEVVAVEDINTIDLPEITRKMLVEDLMVKSYLIVPVFYGNIIYGAFVFHYVNNFMKFSQNDIDMAQQIANQSATVIHQAKLYEITKINAKRESLIGYVTAKAISTFDINEIKPIVNEIGLMTKADRCYFVEVDLENVRGKKINYEGEYLSSPGVKSIMGYEFPPEDVSTFVELYLNAKDVIVFDYEKIKNEQNEQNQGIVRYSTLFQMKSGVGIPIFYRGELTSVLVIEYCKEKVLPSEDELAFLRILGNQIGMAFNQIKNYQNIKKTAEKERALRLIMGIVRSSLDINEIKNTFVTEIGQYFNANRCFIYDFGKDIRSGIFSEYTSSPEIKRMSESDFSKPQFKYWENELFSANSISGTFLDNLEQFIISNNLQNTPVEEHMREFDIKSAVGIPIMYMDQTYGALIIQYTDKYVSVSDEDKEFLTILVDQFAIAMHQARLYNITKLQAEREKISRNIIEILRGSLDKNTIKHLFVKNIGKYFNADRVFFSDYDSEAGSYMPIDKNSEYLSSPEEKSFVDFDFSDDSLRGFIQPLLEKRELKILSWDEYIQEKPKTDALISRFESANVKSSYNLPVLYQQQIMGYFCIEFTHNVVQLSDEDVNRIRSICTQAGIALYQAELFQKAQDSDRVKGEFIANISSKFREPLTNIIAISEKMPKTEIDCEKQAEDLENINKTGKQLLDFTDYIANASKKDSFN